MHAVKLSPEELLLVLVRSDWLLLCRVLPRGLPSPGDGAAVPNLFRPGFDPLGVERLLTLDSEGWVTPRVSSSLRFEEKTRSNDGSFSMHSTRDTGRQLNLIWEG